MTTRRSSASSPAPAADRRAPATATATANATATAAARRTAPGPGPDRRSVDPAAARPRLSLVDRRSLRSARVRRSLLGLVMSVLVVALFAVGLLHAQLVQRQQRLDVLRAEIGETRAERLGLSREIVVASSPDEIVRRAREIGMVRAQDPVYLVAVRPVGQG